MSATAPTATSARTRLAAAVQVVRRIRLNRVLQVAAVVAAAALVLVETPVAAGLHGIPLPLALGLAVVHAGSVPLALRRPMIGALVALAAALAFQALDTATSGPRPWWPALIVTHAFVLAAVAVRVRWAAWTAQWLVALIASALLAARLHPDGGDGTAVNLTVFGAVTALVMSAAHLAAQWRRIRSELLHERRVAADEAGRRLVMEERTRIARELHDVIAHSMSIITVQSSTARFRHPALDPTAAEELDRIGDLSRQALDEMRGLLRVLRGSEEGAELHPQPGFGDVAELVAQAGRAGTPVSLELADDAGREVGDVTGLTAYRIVQEALSNAIRHAPGAAVRVSCAVHDDRLDVSVVNDAAAGGTARLGPPGHGLVGMAERAASAGGSVRFGATPGGGFAVRAVLPVRPDPLQVMS